MPDWKPTDEQYIALRNDFYDILSDYWMIVELSGTTRLGTPPQAAQISYENALEQAKVYAGKLEELDYLAKFDCEELGRRFFDYRLEIMAKRDFRQSLWHARRAYEELKDPAEMSAETLQRQIDDLKKSNAKLHLELGLAPAKRRPGRPDRSGVKYGTKEELLDAFAPAVQQCLEDGSSPNKKMIEAYLNTPIGSFMYHVKLHYADDSSSIDPWDRMLEDLSLRHPDLNAPADALFRIQRS